MGFKFFGFNMESAEFQGISIDKESFKSEFLKLISIDPNQAASVAFGLLQKTTRLEKELKEVSDFWQHSTTEIKALKNALKQGKKLAADQASTNEETIQDLTVQLQAYDHGRSLRKTKEGQLDEEKLKTKRLEKEVKANNRQIVALEKEVAKEIRKPRKYRDIVGFGTPLGVAHATL